MSKSPTDSANPPILSVGELNDRIRETLRAEFFSVWVSGEISDLSRPRSGHAYFSLKDESSQVRAVMWRSVVQRLNFDLEDGIEVICRGEVDVYEPRGTYQLIVREIEPRGIGALQLALRKLRDKLAAEGLFDPARKRSLPRFPRRIAVVTSPSGAALRDFLEVARRRWQGTDILLVPTRVQGAGAAREIAQAIRTADAVRPRADALLVTRGGGSLEDLWCFNDEAVVRAIHASKTPVVSAVGHEIDVTLSDLVADVRALTPSEAGELLVPSSDELREGLDTVSRRLLSSVRAVYSHSRSRFDALSQSRVFRQPYSRLRDHERGLDELQARASRLVTQRWQRSGEFLSVLSWPAGIAQSVECSTSRILDYADDGRRGRAPCN